MTKDGSLNKAHVQRLECRLLELARAAKQCKLDNTNTPSPPTLSEAETADVESFLSDMLSIFPLLGLSVFEKTETTKKPGDLLFIESKGIEASGYEDAKGFVVCKGSEARKDEQSGIHQYVSTLRKDLLEQGVLAEGESHHIFTQDQVFGSPSTAAAVILGRSANGRTEWKTEDGKTLKSIQTAAATRSEKD